jgi:hypothetical protein
MEWVNDSIIEPLRENPNTDSTPLMAFCCTLKRMKNNTAPALAILAHPLTVLGLALVLLNDFLLKPLLPSWWTGKLSDLGLLFALPLCLAALLSLFWQPRKAARALLALPAFGAVLLIFLLLKASPLTNHWLTSWLPLRALPDASDLLALPAWLAALFLWLRPPAAARPSRSWLLLLPLAAMLTLADAAAPDYGIACFQLDGSSLRAGGMYSAYVSQDGGRTWQSGQIQNNERCLGQDKDKQIELTASRGASYRLTIGQKIERSTGGQTWETVFTPQPLSEAEDAYLRKTMPTNIYYQPGPLDGVIDPQSGNLVAAMGLEGVLIVPPSGAPEWAAVSTYRHASLKSVGWVGYATLLYNEFGLAIAGALAWLATASLRLRRATWQVVLTVLGLIILAGAGFALTPDLANASYTAMFSMLALLLALLWNLGLVITAGLRQRKRPMRPFVRRLLFVPLAVVLLLLPYVAWALGLLPFYWIAQLAAAALLVALVVIIN